MTAFLSNQMQLLMLLVKQTTLLIKQTKCSNIERVRNFTHGPTLVLLIYVFEDHICKQKFQVIILCRVIMLAL